MWSNTPATDLASPVTSAELADFLGLDYAASLDAELQRHIMTAARVALAYTNHELATRQYTFLARLQQPHDSIRLPVTPVREIISVECEGDAVEFEPWITMRPAEITVQGYYREFSVVYTAGYAAIPEHYKMAITQMAAHSYETRGCDSADMIHGSGAAGALGMLRMRYGML